MRRIMLAFMFIFTAHSIFYLAPVFSQESNDTAGIINIISDYLESFTYRETSFSKKVISPKFSATIGGQDVDYEHFESVRSSQIEEFYRNHVDYFLSGLDISKLEVSDNKASAVASFRWKAFNLGTLKEDAGKEVQKFLLVKEDNTWKIASVIELPAAEEDSSVLFNRDPGFPEIKIIVDRYLQAFARKDVDSIMSVISLKYNDMVDGKVIDYSAEKKFLEFVFNVILKKFNNCSILEIRYEHFENKDGVARVRVNYIWTGDNGETGKREEYRRGRDLEFIKENGRWMIVRLGRE